MQASQAFHHRWSLADETGRRRSPFSFAITAQMEASAPSQRWSLADETRRRSITAQMQASSSPSQHFVHHWSLADGTRKIRPALKMCCASDEATIYTRERHGRRGDAHLADTLFGFDRRIDKESSSAMFKDDSWAILSDEQTLCSDGQCDPSILVSSTSFDRRLDKEKGSSSAMFKDDSWAILSDEQFIARVQTLCSDGQFDPSMFSQKEMLEFYDRRFDYLEKSKELSDLVGNVDLITPLRRLREQQRISYDAVMDEVIDDTGLNSPFEKEKVDQTVRKAASM